MAPYPSDAPPRRLALLPVRVAGAALHLAWWVAWQARRTPTDGARPLD